MTSEMAEEIKNLIVNFNFDISSLEEDNLDNSIYYLGFSVPGDVEKHFAVRVFEDHVVFRRMAKNITYMYSTYKNENLYEEIKAILKPIEDKYWEENPIPEPTPTPMPYEDYLKQYPEVKSFEKIYTGTAYKGLKEMEWGMCRIETDKDDILYRAYEKEIIDEDKDYFLYNLTDI